MNIRNTKNLVTIKTYAWLNDVTTSCIYKVIKQGKLNYVLVDGIKFIDITDEY